MNRRAVDLRTFDWLKGLRIENMLRKLGSRRLCGIACSCWWVVTIYDFLRVLLERARCQHLISRSRSYKKSQNTIVCGETLCLFLRLSIVYRPKIRRLHDLKIVCATRISGSAVSGLYKKVGPTYASKRSRMSNMWREQIR